MKQAGPSHRHRARRRRKIGRRRRPPARRTARRRRLVFHEVCRPVNRRRDRAADEPAEQASSLPPPSGGTRLRVIDFPPEREGGERVDARAGLAPRSRRSARLDGDIAARARRIPSCTAPRRSITASFSKARSSCPRRRRDRLEGRRRRRPARHQPRLGEPVNCRMAFVLIDGAFEGDLADSTSATSSSSPAPAFRGKRPRHLSRPWTGREGHRVEDVATPEVFARDPALVHAFYDARRARLGQSSPTPRTARWPGSTPNGRASR